MAICDVEARWLSRSRQRLSRRRQRAYYEALRLAARYVYSIKLCRVQRICRDGQIIYRKQRLARSAALVELSNWWQSHSSGTLYGLPEAQWLDWERRLAPATSNCRAGVQGRTLWTRAFPGASLRHWLASARVERATKRQAFMTAAGELRRLHTLLMPCPDGLTRLWSHGDAHAGNVFFDVAQQRATWFDFEAVHGPHLGAAWRQADDLRALIFSSGAYLPLHDVPDLAAWAVAAINRTGADKEVLRELHAIVQQMQKLPTLFQLAQAPLQFAWHRRLSAALVSALERTISPAI